MLVLNLIRSFLFNIYFILMSFICATIGIIFLFGKRETAFLAPQIWEKLLSLGAKYILGLTYQVEGVENLPSGPYIIASKHQSAWETYSFCGIFKGSIFVAKKELSHLPLMNFHFKKQKTIFVNRKLGAAAREDMIKQAKERISDGDRIIIYPEGRRKSPFEKPKYKNGIAGLYQELNVPVVPVALNSGLFWPRRSFIKNPGTITVSILPPILPGLSSDEFMKTLETSIETKCHELYTKVPTHRD